MQGNKSQQVKPSTFKNTQVYDTKKSADYSVIADLFSYPGVELYKKKIANAGVYIHEAFPKIAPFIENFLDFVKSTPEQQVQELFLRTFDVQSITTLDIGFVLFGEDYKRGQLLVNLNEEHNKVGNACGTELSDYLPNLLRLLSKMDNDEIRHDIATLLVIPALEKMVQDFVLTKIQKKDEIYKKHQKVILEYSQDYRTVFQWPLRTLLMILCEEYNIPVVSDESQQEASETQGIASYIQAEPEAPAFEQNIEAELLIEK